MKSIPAFAAVCLLAASACAAPSHIFNTGVDDSDHVLPDGSLDAHYTINVFGFTPGFVDSTLRAPPANATSGWIRTPAGHTDPGTYPTTTNFTDDIVEPITITGRWAASLVGVGISLNNINDVVDVTPNPSNGDWTSFSISSTTQVGANTLEFFPADDGTVVEGLRVEILSVTVPEPASVGLLILAVCGLGFRRQRWPVGPGL